MKRSRPVPPHRRTRHDGKEEQARNSGKRLERKKHRARLRIVPVCGRTGQQPREYLRVRDEVRQAQQRFAPTRSQDQRHGERRDRPGAIGPSVEQREDELREQQDEHQVAREEP